MTTAIPMLSQAEAELLSGAAASHKAGDEAFNGWLAHQAGMWTLGFANAMLRGEPLTRISSVKPTLLAWLHENHLAGPETFERSLVRLVMVQSQLALLHQLTMQFIRQVMVHRLYMLWATMRATSSMPETHTR